MARKDLVVKRVMALDLNTPQNVVEQFLVIIGLTLISRHNDEVSAIDVMNKGNADRELARNRMQNRR